MIALIEGVEGGSIDLFKASSATLKAMVLDDTGVQIDITDAVVELLIYTYEDRREAVTDSVIGTHTSETGGLASFAFVPADLNYGPQLNNAPYWGYVKVTTVGGVESVGRTPVKINIV